MIAGAEEVADAIQQTLAELRTEKPVLAVVMSAEGTPSALRAADSSVAAFPYPESAARALGLAADRAEWLRRPAGSVRTLDGVDAARARDVVDQALSGSTEVWLDPATTRELLEAYGLPLVPERLAADAPEAVAAARELGFPVVVKTAAAGVHKSETGGVVLDLADEDAVRSTVEAMGGPVLVQRQVAGGAELLAGIVQDPVFGPLVAFGPGGVFAELIGDAAFRIAPLTDIDAEELVLTGQGRTPRARLPRVASGRRAGARRPRRAPRPARRGPARGGRARPQSRARPAQRVRRRRRASPAARAHRGHSLKSW